MSNFDPPIELHKELNPVLWADERILPEVNLALLRIAREFHKFLDIDAPLVDVVISGSQANYNYTEHSDIDLHLIVDMTGIQCDEPIQELFDAKRKLWKLKHTIDIHGIPVEAYAEDSLKPAVSSSYSLLTNTWQRGPDTPVIDYNRAEVERRVDMWRRVIFAALASREIHQLELVSDLLIKYRKLGLAQDGEFGAANLTFKSLRNSGLLDELRQTLDRLKDLDLSLD